MERSKHGSAGQRGKHQRENYLERRVRHQAWRICKCGSELLLRGGPISDIGYELGGDIEFGVAAIKLHIKIIGLYRSSHESNDSSIEVLRAGQPVTLFETCSRNKGTEAVVRVQNAGQQVYARLLYLPRHACERRSDAGYQPRTCAASTHTFDTAGQVLTAKKTRRN